MDASTRIARLVEARNRERALESFGDIALGLLYAALTFAVIFWLAWIFGMGLAGALGMRTTTFAGAVTGVFFVVAAGSAWRQVDPLASLPPLSKRQELLTLLSTASPSVLYFSPRHASAGAAMLLLGGPVNILRGVGSWRFRIRWGGADPARAAALLARAAQGAPLSEIRDLDAALVLRRIGLVRVVGVGPTATLDATEKGREALLGA